MKISITIEKWECFASIEWESKKIYFNYIQEKETWV